MPHFPFRRWFGWAAFAAVAIAAGFWAWPREQPRGPRIHVVKVPPPPPQGSLVGSKSATSAPDAPVDLEAELRALALKNPMRAMQLAREGLEGPALERTFLFALRQLAAVDPQGAAAFVLTMPADQLQLFATEEMVRIEFPLGVAAALAWVARLVPDSPMHQRAVAEVAGLWAAQDRAAAMRFVESLPPGASQTAAAARAAKVISATEAGEALAWALTLDKAARDAALQEIGGSWGNRDPAAAARSIAAQSLDAAPPLALHLALLGWMQRDLPAALLFVRTLKRDRQADAMEFVTPLAAKQDPLQAADWAYRFSPRMSETALYVILNQWLESDPKGAQAWMNQKLSQKRQAAILNGPR